MKLTLITFIINVSRLAFSRNNTRTIVSVMSFRLLRNQVSRNITLSISGSVPYRYKLFRYSLDRYITVCVHIWSGTVPIHLSTLQTERTKLYRNSLFRNEPHKILGFGSDRYGMSDAFTDVDRWINTVPVPYRSKNASIVLIHRDVMITKS